MANVTITQLPAAGPITGTESVPIVQNGQTVQTTTGAIAASPSQNQTFLTLNNEPSLPNSRYLSTGTGLGLNDGGAQSDLEIILNGASGSLEAAGNGVIVKTGGTTVAARTISTSGAGLTISNGNGVSGNPTIALDGLAASLANMSGTGILGVVGGASITSMVITGTTNQIDVVNGAGPGNPTLSISTNPVLPGTGAMTVPKGTTAQRPGGVDGMLRFNTDTDAFEIYDSGGWSALPAGAITLIDTGTGLTGGPITTSGTISIANTGVTAATYGSASAVPQLAINAQGQVTTASDVSIAISASQVTSGIFTTTQGGTGVSTYAAGDLIYYATGTAMTKLAIGSSTYVMTSSGTAPQWTDPSSISVGSATTATTSTNIAGGAGGQIAYNSNASTTTFLPLGTLGYLLEAGLTAPQYVDPATITVGNATTAGTASTATTATNIGGGAAGSIPYQTAPGTTTFLAAGSGVLVGGSTPAYSTTPTLTGTNFSAIPNAALTNSSITLGTTTVSLGATATTLAGFTSVSVTGNPTSNLELTPKQYVDALVSSGVHFHQPVRVESPTNLNATYNNGTSGVGATLTNAGTQVALAIDGVTLSVNDRVLVYTQTDQTQNGIYVVTDVGSGSTNWVLTRSADANTYGLASSTTLGEGSTVFVQEGATGAGESYTCNTAGVITFGTTNITFAQISSAQIYTAGTGLTLTGTQFSLTTPVAAANGGTGISSYAAGDLVYANTTTSLNKLAIGVASRILTSTGSAPTWTDPASITVGSATTATTATSATSATTATNVAAGLANEILYQSAPGTTAFIAAPTTPSTYLGWDGSAFTWGAVSASSAVNLSGGSAGSVVYQSATGITAYLNLGTSTYLLRAGASAPEYVDPATVTVGFATSATSATSATTATNVAGGAANRIVYNTASGTTSFITAPTVANTNLSWSGSAFTWNAAFDPASPGPIGGTTPDAGTFTTLTATGQTSLGGSAGGEGLRVLNVASTVNYLEIQGATATNGPIVTTVGTDTNIPLNFRVKGSGSFRFNTNNTLGTEQFRVAHTASAVNYVQVTGAATGSGPIISAQGSDTNVDLLFSTKGTAGSHVFRTNGTVRQFQVNHLTSAVNYGTVVGAVTGSGPIFGVAGTDTNIDLTLTPKGTGKVTTAAALVATGGISGGTF